MTDGELFESYNLANVKLTKYEWVISPFWFFQFVKPKFIDFIKRLPGTPTLRDKEHYGKMIADEIFVNTLLYKFRAILIEEGYCNLQPIDKFSHLVEIGLLELYDLNLITCEGVLTPLPEGIILQLIGEREFVRIDNSNIQRMMSLRAGRPELQPLLTYIVENLLTLLSNTLYKQVRRRSDLPLLNFNRHIWAHLSSIDPTYHRDNCLRMVHILDSLLAINAIIKDDFIRIKHIIFETFFNGKNKLVGNREKYYEETVRNGLSNLNLRRVELLKKHPYFKEGFYFRKSA
ncbi:MAG: hypothetical protein HY761_03070 [Candidatus Omnitrophica bacterium]|nr:hypothetical protein [Candidatus Omnitrophota bacterium]